jgi:hypothetical protein
MPDYDIGSKLAMFSKNIIDREGGIKVHNNPSNISYSTKKRKVDHGQRSVEVNGSDCNFPRFHD